MNATACASSSLPTPTLRPKKLQSVLAVFEATIDQNAVRGDCNSKSFLGNSAAIKSQRRSSLDGSRNSGCVPAQTEPQSATNPVAKATIQTYQRRASVGSTPLAVSRMSGNGIGGEEKAPVEPLIVVTPAPSPENGHEKSTKETGSVVRPMNGATAALVAAGHPSLALAIDSNKVSSVAEMSFDIARAAKSSSVASETDLDESEASLDNLWDSDGGNSSPVTTEPLPLSRRRICRVGSSATVEFHDSTDNMHADYFLASFEEQKRLARLRSIPQRTKSKSLAQSRPLAERMQAFGNTAM
jgi:hypothetical protein